MDWGWGGDSNGWYAANTSMWSPSTKPDVELSTASAWMIYNFRIY